MGLMWVVTWLTRSSPLTIMRAIGLTNETGTPIPRTAISRSLRNSLNALNTLLRGSLLHQPL